MLAMFVAAVFTFPIDPATVVTLALLPATVVTFELIPATVVILEAIPATVVTSVGFGTSLWNVYVCNVVVVSTKNPKPEAMADGTPVIVTVLPDPAPFAIVTVVPLGVKVVDVP